MNAEIDQNIKLFMDQLKSIQDKYPEYFKDKGITNLFHVQWSSEYRRVVPVEPNMGIVCPEALDECRILYQLYFG